MAEESEDLGGVSDVFGMGTPNTPEQDAAKRRRELDDDDDAEMRDSVKRQQAASDAAKKEAAERQAAIDEEERQESIDANRRLGGDLSPRTAGPAAGAGPTANQIKDDAFKDLIGPSADEPPKKESSSGCSPKLMAIAVAIVAVILGVIALLAGDDDKKADTADTTTTEEEPDAPPAGGTFAPPEPSELPKGAVVFEGSSGGEIGCITCDGQSRFLHLQKATFAVGDANRASMEIVWPEDGEVVEFGANLSGPNKGRYGFNLFPNAQYANGCSMEIGERSCRQQTVSKLTKGDRVSIIVGEGGTVDDKGVPLPKGDVVVTWWFVFQPS